MIWGYISIIIGHAKHKIQSRCINKPLKSVKLFKNSVWVSAKLRCIAAEDIFKLHIPKNHSPSLYKEIVQSIIKKWYIAQ